MGDHMHIFVLLIVNVAFLHACTVTVMNPLSGFDDLLVNEYLLWSHHVTLRLDCLAKCFYDFRCRSFQFKAPNTCRGFASSFSSPDKLHSSMSTAAGFRLFLMPSASNFIGSTCSGDTDCNVANTLCNQGICTCAQTFIYDPNQGSCVTGCTAWGDEMTKFVDSLVRLLDDNTFPGISEAECVQKCIDAKDDTFTCLSAEYSLSLSKCHTSKITYGTAPAESRVNFSAWRYYHRNCAVTPRT